MGVFALIHGFILGTLYRLFNLAATFVSSICTFYLGKIYLFVHVASFNLFRFLYKRKKRELPLITDGILFEPAFSLAKKIRTKQFLYKNKKQKLPLVTDGILLESALSLAKKIRTKKLKCHDVIECYIKRIKEVDPIIHATVDQRFFEALDSAQKVDELVNSGLKSERELEEQLPLLGVPFTLKESIKVRGMLNTAGFITRKDVRASEDAPIVTAMRKAGGIPLANTNVSQMCMWWESSNNLYGTTNNPYDTGRTVGGSSGGEGALIAAAGSVIGIGSDIAGSIRIPSFYNGIFGHKPSKDINPVTGKFPKCDGELRSFGVTGPMCRYATDLSPVLKIMAGENASRLKLDKRVDLKTLKFYYLGGIDHPFVPALDPELKEAQKKVLAHIERSYNVKPKLVSMDKMTNAIAIWTHKMKGARAPTFANELGNRKGEISLKWEFFKWFLRLSNHTLPALGLALYEKMTPDIDSQDHAYYRKMFIDIQKEFDDLLGHDGVMIMPSFPEPAPYHNYSILNPNGIIYTCLFNVLGLPVTQCPVGLNSENIPLGVQVVSGLNNDHLTIAVAVDLEANFGGWNCPNKVQLLKNN